MQTGTSQASLLILTARTGGGHMNLALSLIDALRPDGYRVAIADPYGSVVQGGYAQWSRFDTRFWGMVYRLSDHRLTSLVAHTALTRLIARRLSSILARSDCDLILTTHPWLSYEVAACLKRLGRSIPLVFQITDLVCHHMWTAYRQADLYLASTQEIYSGLVAGGIDPQRVVLTGRPVRAQFLANIAAEDELATAQLLASLDLDLHKPTVFVQGGAEGSTDLRATMSVIASFGGSLQVILAAGHNQSLQRRYAGIAGVRALPFVEDIARYMAASAIVIGKPGASYLTQAFMLAKPFMATTFIHGHEAPNLRFIERHDLGWVCLHHREQRQVLAMLLAGGAALASKTASVRHYRDLNAAWMRQLPTAIRGVLQRR